jgi:hypothetical protein
MNKISEIINIPPTDAETIMNLFRSWLNMSGHTAYAMGMAKARGVATMGPHNDAYGFLHRNLYPYAEITAINIRHTSRDLYAVHVYARGINLWLIST